jgi:hypothetical protein
MLDPQLGRQDDKGVTFLAVSLRPRPDLCRLFLRNAQKVA